MTEPRDRDPEAWVAARLREALRPAWPGLWVSRARTNQTPAVTVQRAGGATGLFADDWRLLLNLYAATDEAANALVTDTAAALLRLRRHAGIKAVAVNGWSSVPTTATEPAHRLVTCDLRALRAVVAS